MSGHRVNRVPLIGYMESSEPRKRLKPGAAGAAIER